MEKKLITAFLGYLTERCKSLQEEARESVEVSVQCLSEAFGISARDLERKNLPISPDVLISSLAAMADDPKTEETAEDMKVKGNQEMSNRDYQKAIECYSEAILLNAENPIYYSNRAAAYLALGRYEEALEDSRKAVDLNPEYSKAYVRLGQSYFHLDRIDESLEAYNAAKKLDPSNRTIDEAIEQAKGGASREPGIDPGIIDMAKNILGDGVVSDLLKNPAITEMAQKLCSDPSKLQNFMSSFMPQRK